MASANSTVPVREKVRQRVNRLLREASLKTNRFDFDFDIESFETKDVQQQIEEIEQIVKDIRDPSRLCINNPFADECYGLMGPYSNLYMYTFGVGIIFGPLDLNALYVVLWFAFLELAYWLVYGYTSASVAPVRVVTFFCYLLGFVVGRTLTVYSSDVLSDRDETAIRQSEIYQSVNLRSFFLSSAETAAVSVAAVAELSDRVKRWLYS